jgi:SAM-dependent methyltransferase
MEMFERPAAAYDRFVGRYGRALGRELIAFAGVQEGSSAVDVGCGPGPLTTELAALLGADRVAAADPSEAFAAACRSRLPGVRVEVAAAEALPFADGEFDHALAQLVVNFMADAGRGVGEMARVTRPGGSVTAAVWDYGGGMTLLRGFWDAALAIDPEAADEARTMRFATPDELGALWREAGLADVSTSSADVAARYEGFDDLWEPFEAGIGPAGAYTVALDDDRRAALKAELRRRLDAGDEPFSLTARAWLVRGASP